MNPLLSVNHLLKSYNTSTGRHTAVNDISFSIYPGEILGFLGPNGAGKSTTLNIIATLLNQDEGQILFKNTPVHDRNLEYKRALGLVPQDIALFSDLTAYENVRFFCSLYGIKGEQLNIYTENALHYVGLWEYKNQYPDTFSGGMKRRLNIACSIAHQPELIIMDEPTVGIDPQSRNKILELTKDLASHGSTIIYTSHYMEEVEAVCSRLIFLDHGQIIEEGRLEVIKNKYAPLGLLQLEAIFLHLTGTQLRDQEV